MKKPLLASLIAASAISALLISGCGPTSESKPKEKESTKTEKIDGTGKTLTVLFDANTNFAEQQKQWFDRIKGKFKDETGADIVFETFATANDELTKIQTSVVSGQGPDIYAIGTTFTPTAYGTGAFVTLGDKEWEKVGGKDRFAEASLGISGPDKDNLIAIPSRSRPFVMAYNKDLLAAAGIDKPATTWDDFVEHSKKMTKDGVYGAAIAYADNFDPWKFIWAMAAEAGNPIVDGDKLRLSEDTVYNAYEAYFNWLTEDKIVDPAAVGWKNSQALAAFADGKAAYYPLTSPTSQITLKDSKIKDSYAYTIMPTVPPGYDKRPKGGVEAASILSGSNFVVASYSKNQDLAFALVKLLTSEEEQMFFYETFGDLPTNVAAADKLAKDDPNLAVFIEASKLSKATPFTGAWADIQLSLTNVAVQSIPALNSGSVNKNDTKKLIDTEQEKSQAALDRAQ